MQIDSEQFQQQLIRWYKKAQRNLPWRHTKNPYLIWISEVLLQQTQVNTVLKYYQKFIAKFPNIQSLANADLQQVLKAWEGLGYYARARNLHKAAQILLTNFGGEFPSNYAAFRSLPGAGDYITAAVLSLAFKAPHAVVDGNVKRVLSRLFLVDTPINGSAAKNIFAEYANTLLNRQQPDVFNQAMMELGALICKPKQPICEQCPITTFCEAFKSNRQQFFPVKNKQKVVPKYYIAVGVIFQDNQILIVQRQPDGLLGGLWEFPGGKILYGKSAEQACLDNIMDKVNLSVIIIEPIAKIKHAYSHFKIELAAFRCRYLSGNVKLNGHAAYRWINIQDVAQFPFHAANHKLLPQLTQYFGE